MAFGFAIDPELTLLDKHRGSSLRGKHGRLALDPRVPEWPSSRIILCASIAVLHVPQCKPECRVDLLLCLRAKGNEGPEAEEVGNRPARFCQVAHRTSLDLRTDSGHKYAEKQAHAFTRKKVPYLPVDPCLSSARCSGPCSQ